jgi:hypothetical protein
MWQVMRSKVPFRDMGKKAYIQEVVVGGRRPPLERNWPEGFSELLVKCWHEDRDARPTFIQVVEVLDSLIQEVYIYIYIYIYIYVYIYMYIYIIYICIYINIYKYIYMYI